MGYPNLILQTFYGFNFLQPADLPAQRAATCQLHLCSFCKSKQIDQSNGVAPWLRTYGLVDGGTWVAIADWLEARCDSQEGAVAL